MHRTRPWIAGPLLGLFVVLHGGCMTSGLPRNRPKSSTAAFFPAAGSSTEEEQDVKPSIDPRPLVDDRDGAKAHLFGDSLELPLKSVLEQVLARNPTIAQMTAAYQAAQARYPQVTSLDDPMLDVGIGPATIGADNVNFAYRVQISQRYPWHGKRALRGENALALASAAGHDIDDVRLQLIESTRAAFYDFYLAERALSVNDEADRLLKEFRENALTRFRTGQAPQQDVLQADVEIGRTRERRLALQRIRQVAIARINTLLHLPTASPLPPPPEQLPPTEALPNSGELQGRAVAARPDLKAISDRIAAEQAALALAFKEYYPDVQPFFMWDRFMGNRDVEMAPQIGVQMNLPVRKERRAAALAEASARIAERQAELERLTDQVNFQVEEAFQQVVESEKTVRLYDETILPAARENVKAALAAYTTGKTPFLSLIEAERNLVELRDRYYEASANVYRRRATLERVTGGSLESSAVPSPANTGTAPAKK
jgi:cobalt-zinc-cadmium efflux system outer membrane protein